MKKLFTLIIVTGLLSVSGICFGQGQLKLGHVNISEIMAQLPERDSADLILDKETKEIQATY